MSVILLGTAWLSKQVSSRALDAIDPNGYVGLQQSGLRNELRKDVLEALDRCVAYENYYHSVYGHYTKLLNRIGYSIPSHLAENYDVRVVEASNDRLIVSASLELNGKIQDLISIDQDFQIHSNFPLPSPRPGYLKSVAKKHMRTLKEAPPGKLETENSLFKGYFKYTLTEDSQGERMVLAEGVLSPVKGVSLEWKGGEGEDRVEESESSHSTTGQQGSGAEVADLQGQTYLAQKIFHGEIGRYAKTWSELSRITHFRFQDRGELESKGGRNTVTSGNNVENSQSSPMTEGQISIPQRGGVARKITSHKPLEFEAISPSDAGLEDAGR